MWFLWDWYFICNYYHLAPPWWSSWLWFCRAAASGSPSFGAHFWTLLCNCQRFVQDIHTATSEKYNWCRKTVFTPGSFVFICFPKESNATQQKIAPLQFEWNILFQSPRLSWPGAVDPMYFSSLPLGENDDSQNWSWNSSYLMLNFSESSFGAFLSPIIPAFSHLEISGWYARLPGGPSSNRSVLLLQEINYYAKNYLLPPHLLQVSWTNSILSTN